MKFNKLVAKKIFYIIVAVVLLLLVFLNTFLLIRYSILPLKYMLVYYFFVGVIPILLILFTIFRRRHSKVKFIFGIIEVIYIILLTIVFIYLNRTFDFINTFTHNFEYETKNYYVLVLNNNKYKDIKNLKNKSLGYTKGFDESINHALEELNKTVKTKNELVEGYGDLFDKLYNNELDSIIMVQGLYDTLTETDYDAKIKTKILYKFSIKEPVNKISKDVDVTKEAFNIYISGIDSYGSVTDKTRSDVNILMSINPKTNSILLINIPRDYYVSLHGINQKDKLTHAGIYGVETSARTIEDLLDTEINYYVKVNYSALIGLVDALDGVDVYSEYDFSTHDHHYRIKKGMNYVNGKKALDFVRTRKAFTDGDRVRGENQEHMIEAIIKKASSPAILIRYDAMLKALEGNFSTNMSTDSIMAIINNQLDKMPTWKINSTSVNGTDAYDYTYSYPSQQLYVMVPTEETITEAKAAIKENMK